MATESAGNKLFDRASDMEPLLPETDPELTNLTIARPRCRTAKYSPAPDHAQISRRPGPVHEQLLFEPH